MKGRGLTSSKPMEGVAFEDQRKIDELTQTGIYYYWHGGDLKKVEEALGTYDEILEIYPGSFEANILSAVYSNIQGDGEAYAEKMEFLGKTYPQLTKEYIEKFNRTEEYLKTPLNTEAQKIESRNHAIVILGYAFSDEGEMKAPLIGRLEQGLAAARLNPESEIIVSGGVPKAGVTEAYLMKKWLVEKGSPLKRSIWTIRPRTQLEMLSTPL